MRLLHSAILLLLVQTLVGQAIDLDKLSHKYASESWDLFRELLAIPNDAHNHDDIELNVQWCEKQFMQRGFSLQRLDTETVPLLLASKVSPNKEAKTVLVYLQVDGQPVDYSFWYQDNPYKATLKEKAQEGGFDAIEWHNLHKDKIDPDWRIFARSTSDAKGPVVMFLKSIDAINDLGYSPDFNVKVILDFEEEIGSPRLPQAVIEYADELSSDMLVIFDGPMHITNQPTLTFGARGIATITLTLFGPVFPQHSGHYGNYCPNPAVRMAQLIASMKNDDGRVTIPGFYDGITIDKETKVILANVPDDEKMINLKLGIASADTGIAESYQEALQYPSLNVRGMSSGWVGSERRTIIPSSAIAEIDVRLVQETSGDKLLGMIRSHIEDQGYYVIDRKPTTRERAQYDRIISFESENNYSAFRTDFDSDIGQWLYKALLKAHGKEPIRQRTSGGSIPISPFVSTLNIPAVTVPTVNRDNNQHSPNENIRIGNYIDGIKTILSILMEPLDSKK